MKRFYWLVGLVGLILVTAVPLVIFWPQASTISPDPWQHMPTHLTHTDHHDIIQGPFDSPQAVTENCWNVTPILPIR
ncbi:MAG: hypothetical protein R2932_11825 [Caldilineaceae bacterium]